MATPTTTGGTMYTTPAQGHRAGRMLAGLIGSTNKRAQLQLTVDITKATGGSYHQAFRIKAWDSKRDGVRMLTLDLNDGDYMAGTWPTKVAHVNLGTGELKAAAGMQDAAMLYAAKAAVEYAFTGALLQPGNGTVQVEEAATCGCCGLRLTHPVSIDLGIGPECAKRMGLEHHYKGTALTTRAKAKKKATKKEGAAAPAAPTDKWAGITDEERKAYGSYVGQGIADSDGYFGPLSPQAWVNTQRRKAAAAAPATVNEDDPRAQCEHGSTNLLDCLHCHRALLHQLDTDIATTQLLHNQAANAQDYGRAEQLGDVLDTYQAMRSKAVEEWQGNWGNVAWVARVQAHPAAQGLSVGDQQLVAHWCYVNHAPVEETMEALGLAVAV